MGLDSVVEDVLGRGRSEVEEIRRAALAERDRTLQNAQAEGAKLLEVREKEAQQAAERLRVQALARAELEGKKVVLSAEKELLDEVYAKVLGKLAVLEDGAAILQSLLKAHAADWRTGKVYCNEKDANAVRSAVGTSFGGTIDCVGGIVIESGDGTHRIDLRYETLLADVWRDSIREGAEVLWPRRGNLAAVFTQIIGFSEGELRQMIGWYLDRFDVQNIKTIVRGKTFGAPPTEILEDLVPAGSMKESFLQALVELPTLDEAFDRLEGAIYARALASLGKRASEVERWDEWEDRLTQLYYQNLLCVVPERTGGTRLMREFVRREVDIVNLKTLLRVWASKATLPYDPFIAGGRVIARIG